MESVGDNHRSYEERAARMHVLIFSALAAYVIGRRLKRWAFQAPSNQSRRLATDAWLVVLRFLFAAWLFASLAGCLDRLERIHHAAREARARHAPIYFSSDSPSWSDKHSTGLNRALRKPPQ